MFLKNIRCCYCNDYKDTERDPHQKTDIEKENNNDSDNHQK